MSEEAAEDPHVKRQKRFDHLSKTSKNFIALSAPDAVALSTASAMLSTYGEEVLEDPSEVLDTAESCFHTVDGVFTHKFFTKPLIPITILWNVCDFYGITPLTDQFLSELNVRDLRTMNGGLISLIWHGSFLSLAINEFRQIVAQRDRSSSIAHSPRRKPEP